MDAVDTAMLTMRIRNLFILVFFVVLLFGVSSQNHPAAFEQTDEMVQQTARERQRSRGLTLGAVLT
jgi:uncharacterized membrane protein